MFMSVHAALLGFFPPSLHQRLMALHTEDPLRSPGIFEILDFLLAIPTFEAGCAESLVAREDCQVLDLITTDTTAIGTIIADERPITEKEEVCIRVEDGPAGIAPETVYMPSITRWEPVSISVSQCYHYSGWAYRVRKPFLPRGSGRYTSLALRPGSGGGIAARQHGGVGQRTSPHPLHGYAASSCSMGDSGNPTAVSIASARGLPEPTTVVAIDDRRQGQRIDRTFELLRRLACSIHGTQARPAHITQLKEAS